MCFLFPLGAVLMRGNAGALTEGHNEVRSTGETAVICDGLNTLRGGEQLLFGGAIAAAISLIVNIIIGALSK